MSLEYINIDVGEDRTKLSPSGFANFYENASYWYKTQIKKDIKFEGNTNTVVGTLIHGRIEDWFNKEYVNIDKEYEYVSSYDKVAEVDEWKVNGEVERLWEVIEPMLKTKEVPSHMEEQIVFDIPNSKYTLAGTYDYRYDKVLGDIKTTSVTPKKIKLAHKIQLYIYYTILKMNQVDIKEIEVMYIVKLKSKPKVIILKEPIDEEFEIFVRDEIKNMVTRLNMAEENQDMVPILFPENKDSFLK